VWDSPGRDGATTRPHRSGRVIDAADGRQPPLVASLLPLAVRARVRRVRRGAATERGSASLGTCQTTAAGRTAALPRPVTAKAKWLARLMLESAGVDLPRLQLAAGALRATSDSAAFAALAEPRLRGGRPRRPSVCARPRVAAIPRRSGVTIDRRWPERARARAAGRVLDALGRSVAQPAARSMTIGAPKWFSPPPVRRSLHPAGVWVAVDPGLGGDLLRERLDRAGARRQAHLQGGAAAGALELKQLARAPDVKRAAPLGAAGHSTSMATLMTQATPGGEKG
jgi:hypothetical protein